MSDELAELIARAQAVQPLTGFDPLDLVEREPEPAPGRPRLTAKDRARRLVLGELLAALLVARTRRDPWYVWIQEEWPKLKGQVNS